MKKDVVILAAGLGSRMGKLTLTKPKCVLRINEKAIIVRLIEQLRANENIDNIVIVVGYLSQVIKCELSEFNDLIFVENQEYKVTNNMWSFCLTRLYLSPQNGLITINADCIYSNEIISSIGGSHSSQVYTHALLYDEEAMKVKVDNKYAVELSKEFKKDQSVFNCIDLYEFDSTTKEIIYEELDIWCRTKSKNDWFEKGINDCLVQEKIRMEVTGFMCNWVEIDTEEDYMKAKTLFS